MTIEPTPEEKENETIDEADSRRGAAPSFGSSSRAAPCPPHSSAGRGRGAGPGPGPATNAARPHGGAGRGMGGRKWGGHTVRHKRTIPCQGKARKR